MIQPQFVTSSQFLRDFTVDQLEGRHITILSVLNDMLLVGFRGLSQLLIINCEGHYVSTIRINYCDHCHLYDATWTPRGKIVYTTYNKEIAVMSASDKEVFTSQTMSDPRRFSVSNDDVIYLADWEDGVFQSTDNGFNWNLVFKPPDGRHCLQVIKVFNDDSEDFWALESENNNSYLRIYSLNKRHSDDNIMAWRNVDVHTSDGNCIDISANSSLSYDGNMSVFINDCDNSTIHIFSVKGHHHNVLLSSDQMKNCTYKLAVDTNYQRLYLGQCGSTVRVFQFS